MYNNRLKSTLKYFKFLAWKQRSLYEEFNKNEELKVLIKANSMNTVFQPILSLCNGKTVGFEILNRPHHSLMFPTTEKFYDFVGQSNNVFLTEGYLRNLSLERYSNQLNLTPDYRNCLVFLNIQPRVLSDPAYRSGKTLELLEKYNLSPNQVVLELTEKEGILDYNQFERTIENYREQGFRIAVDDAGTGYNSLKTIVSLKPEFIKIDKSLIRDITKHPVQQHLVELLLEFSVLSKTNVIAEGIENTEELQFLKNLGVLYGQGFGLGKPASTLKDGMLPPTFFTSGKDLSNVYDL